MQEHESVIVEPGGADGGRLGNDGMSLLLAEIPAEGDDPRGCGAAPIVGVYDPECPILFRERLVASNRPPPTMTSSSPISCPTPCLRAKTTHPSVQ